MNAQDVGGFGQVAVRFREHSRDEAALELPARVGEADPFHDHLLDQAFETFVHRYSNSSPLRSWKAWMYFSLVFWMTSSGRPGTGGCLFQRIDSR